MFNGQNNLEFLNFTAYSIDPGQSANLYCGTGNSTDEDFFDFPAHGSH